MPSRRSCSFGNNFHCSHYRVRYSSPRHIGCICMCILFLYSLVPGLSAQVEVFHHSRDVSATIASLIATLDRASGTVIKKNPRFVCVADSITEILNRQLYSVLTKGTSAEIQIALRPSSVSNPGPARPIPLEPFSINKDMGRVLIRRGGETIAAGRLSYILMFSWLLMNGHTGVVLEIFG